MPTQTLEESRGGAQRRGREGRLAKRKRKRKRKEMRGRREMCPWAWGHWSRQSWERGMRGRWGREGCWRSSDLEERANQRAKVWTHDF